MRAYTENVWLSSAGESDVLTYWIVRTTVLKIVYAMVLSLQGGELMLDCTVESMELGEGDRTAKVAVRDQTLFTQSNRQVVSEALVVLRASITPRSALIIFPGVNVDINDVEAGSIPTWAPLTFANFGQLSTSGTTGEEDSCSSDNTLSFSIERVESEQIVDVWMQVMPENNITSLRWIGTETKIHLNFTRTLEVCIAYDLCVFWPNSYTRPNYMHSISLTWEYYIMLSNHGILFICTYGKSCHEATGLEFFIPMQHM